MVGGGRFGGQNDIFTFPSLRLFAHTLTVLLPTSSPARSDAPAFELFELRTGGTGLEVLSLPAEQDAAWAMSLSVKREASGSNN